jgi:BirA family biotin operon repressor/biotin-[acetyl-CoA-carboxylase] ligase
LSELARFVADLGPDLAGPGNRVTVTRVDSTNRLARRVIATYQAEEMAPPEFLVLALEQTSGRGRQGRSWISPPGAGVYGTRVLRLPTTGGAGGDAVTEALQSLPLLAGVGLARPINRMLAAAGAERRCSLKWPNDLLLGGAKVGGILAESLALGAAPPVALVGFGLNYGRPRRGPELPPGATAFADHAGAERPSLGGFVRAVVTGLEAELAHLGELPYAVGAYRELSAHRPGDRLRCRAGAETTEGEFQGFDERGHLRLLRDGETVLLSAGEIVER